MSLYSQLCTLIDNQNVPQLEQFLVTHPELDLNHTTQTGLSALWYAMHPQQNKRPSAAIITLLIASKRVDTNQKLHEQSIRHLAQDAILEIIETLGNPWQEPEQPIVSLSADTENIVKAYQSFSAQVLTQLMQENAPLFNKYLYYYALKGLPLGATPDAPIDEEIKQWVAHQHQAFKELHADAPNFAPDSGLRDEQFPALRPLTALAKTLGKGQLAYLGCFLQFEKQPLVDVLHYAQGIEDLIAALCTKLQKKLAPTQYIAALQDYELIYRYLQQLHDSERKNFAKKLWITTLSLLKETHEMNSEYAFAQILGDEFATLCPTLHPWLQQLSNEEKLKFFQDYLQKNTQLKTNELIHFAAYWAITNQRVKHFDFTLPIKFQNQDFHGFDLSKIDLTHIEFDHCDLRLTHIADNPSLKERHLTDNLLEDALWVYACRKQKIILINYFLNKNHANAFLNAPVADAATPILMQLASAGLHQSMRAILAKNKSLTVLNAQNEHRETALVVAVLEQQPSAVAAILAVNHTADVIKVDEHDAFAYALRLGNQEVIREFYRVNMTYPDTYAKLYHQEDDDLTNAKRLLLDYTKNDQLVLRWLHGHFNRHHVPEVTAIIHKIETNKIATMDELLVALNQIKLENHTGSLARRIMFIEEDKKPIPEKEASCFKGCSW
ncbi:MAG: DUF5617 domain-containing protein [Legionella sp.]